MGWIGKSLKSNRSIRFQLVISQAVSLDLIVALALIIWKRLIYFTGSESPVVLVLSDSMELGLRGAMVSRSKPDKLWPPLFLLMLQLLIVLSWPQIAKAVVYFKNVSYILMMGKRRGLLMRSHPTR